MSTTIDILTRDVIELQHNREYKGKSLIDFPKSYCVIDIETTGLSPDWGRDYRNIGTKIRR